MSESRANKASHALQFNVAQLLKQPTGTKRVYTIDTTMPSLDDDLTVVAPFRGQVRFIRANAGLLVTGDLETVVELECSRCLTTFQTAISFEIEEEFKPILDIVTGASVPQEPDQDQATLIDEQHILDLAEVVRQELVLSLPPSPVCRPDCRGLCPVCGKNRNEESCDCEVETADPRWEALRASLVENQE
jgi:uncharacterized protein